MSSETLVQSTWEKSNSKKEKRLQGCSYISIEPILFYQSSVCFSNIAPWRSSDLNLGSLRWFSFFWPWSTFLLSPKSVPSFFSILTMSLTPSKCWVSSLSSKYVENILTGARATWRREECKILNLLWPEQGGERRRQNRRQESRWPEGFLPWWEEPRRVAKCRRNGKYICAKILEGWCNFLTFCNSGVQ